MMTEVDVDMAIFAISQAVAVLAAAVRDSEARGYVEANKDLVLDDVDRLSDVLAAMQEPVGAAAARPGGVAAQRARSVGAPHHRRPAPERARGRAPVESEPREVASAG